MNKMKKIDKKKQGRNNKRKGAAFELQVRHDLEKRGWTVSKWCNNIEDEKLVPAKHKFNPFSKIMSVGNGFPDFIAFKRMNCDYECNRKICGYEVIGVEAKSAKYLDKEEKQKIEWYLKNKIFSKILIASKDKNKCGGITYETKTLS